MRNAQVLELKNWEDVDNAVRRIGEIDIEIGKIEGEMTLKINEIKEAGNIKAEGLRNERKKLEKNVEFFAINCKDEFLKTRNRVLSFGKVAYRVTSKIIVKSKQACVSALKALGLEKYVRIVEEPNKELMENMDDNMLVKVGAQRKVEDKLRIEPDIEKIRGAS